MSDTPNLVHDWREISREPVADCRVFSVERSVAHVARRRATAHVSSHPLAELGADSADHGGWARSCSCASFATARSESRSRCRPGWSTRGKTRAEAAIRECLEETGYRARNAESLGVVSPNPALFANRLYAYFATNVEPERAVQNSGSELTEPVLVPVSELRGMLLSGEIDHALVATTLWRYLYLHGPR